MPLEKLENLEDLVGMILDFYATTIEKYYSRDIIAGLVAKMGIEELGEDDRRKVTERLRTASVEQIETRITSLVYVILGCLTIKPEKSSGLGPEEFVFETDVHGDLAALLNTLLRTGMVAFDGENPVGMVFYDPLEGREYSLGDLEVCRKGIGEASFIELMRRVQLLPSVIPTEKYGRYINCGDFSDGAQQSEQTIFLILRLGQMYSEQFPESPSPRIIVGNHENFYIMGSESSILDAIMCKNHTFSTDYNTSAEGISANSREKFRVIVEAIRAAVKGGSLCLVHRIGRTIFSHALITVEMIATLSGYFDSMVEAFQKSKGWNGSADRLLKGKIQNLAVELRTLAVLVSKSKKLTEEQIEMLVVALNEFNIIRVELIERHERMIGQSVNSEDTVPDMLPGEQGIVEIMNGGGSGRNHRGSITWQRRSPETKEKNLIPGVKYILGHDPSENNRKWIPAPEIGGRISYIDSFRSSCHNGGLTMAHYFLANGSLFKGEQVFSPDISPFSETSALTPKDIENRALEGFKLVRSALRIQIPSMT
ncbi:MAG: hypothetical protein LBB24_02395 [Rickettsiales bacterium]|jgi:hypothetical protein|nr:hypothetical protein [Rickettsiales bacterium]